MTSPFIGPSGEEIFELLGASAAIGSSSQLSLARIRLAPSCSIALHLHRESTEVFYGLLGSTEVEVKGERITLTPGLTAVVHPHVPHRIWNASRAVAQFLAMSTPAWSPLDVHPVRHELDKQP